MERPLLLVVAVESGVEILFALAAALLGVAISLKRPERRFMLGAGGLGLALVGVVLLGIAAYPGHTLLSLAPVVLVAVSLWRHSRRATPTSMPDAVRKPSPEQARPRDVAQVGACHLQHAPDTAAQYHLGGRERESRHL